MYWLIAFVVLLVIEIITLGLTTIWFAGGALIAFVVSLFCTNIWIQVFVFLFVSVIMLILTRPVAIKYLNQNREKTNVESIIGKIGVVTVAIDNLNGQGTVVVSGQEWTARTKSDTIKIPLESKVKILDVQGVKLIVDKVKED